MQFCFNAAKHTILVLSTQGRSSEPYPVYPTLGKQYALLLIESSSSWCSRPLPPCMCCVTNLVMADTPSPPAPTAKANTHSQKFCRTVMKTVASGVETMMICSVTVIMITYMKARLLVIPLNTLSVASPSFLELISLKTYMTALTIC